MKSKFFQAVQKHQAAFDIVLPDKTIAALEFFALGVMKNNELLHLVGKCDAEEFVIRHILESLFALKFVPENSKFADIGTGAGLPGIPCLIVRPDLTGFLVESKIRKSEFLNKAVKLCKLEDRATIINKQFDESTDPGVSHVFCRALDGFAKKVPRLIKWSESADLIFFAGAAVRDALKKACVDFEEHLIPMSERRYLFVIRRESDAKPPESEKENDQSQGAGSLDQTPA